MMHENGTMQHGRVFFCFEELHVCALKLPNISTILLYQIAK